MISCLDMTFEEVPISGMNGCNMSVLVYTKKGDNSESE